MTTSVIIATYNRCAKLRELLEALKRMSLSNSTNCEIIVVNNNSTDATEQVAAEFLGSKRPSFRYVVERRQGKSHALNTGLRESTGDIVAFTDDDCIPTRNWIESILTEFEKDVHLSVLGGRVELYNKDDIALAVALGTNRRVISTAREVIREPAIIGANMAFRRCVLDVVPEFDTKLGPGAICGIAEDVEMLYRLQRNGFKVLYCPEVLVFHNHGRRSESEDYGQARQYAMGRGALYCKHSLRGDMQILKVAGEEVYGVSKTLIKGLLVGREFPFHKVTLPGLLLGAFRYLRVVTRRNAS